MIEGGDEGLVQSAYDLVGGFVPLVFEVLDLLLTLRKDRRVGESLFKEAGRADERSSLLLEEVVEAPFTGGK